jgi:hypothetical protein
MYRVLIFKQGATMQDMPKWWTRFLEKHSLKSVDDLNEMLKPYSAKFEAKRAESVFDTDKFGDRYFEFPDEGTATMFFLKEIS